MNDYEYRLNNEQLERIEMVLISHLEKKDIQNARKANDIIHEEFFLRYIDAMRHLKNIILVRRNLGDKKVRERFFNNVGTLMVNLENLCEQGQDLAYQDNLKRNEE